MKLSIQNERARLFFWIGCGYLGLWMFVDIVSHPFNFAGYLINELWRFIFILPLNYILFEYTLKQFGRKKYIKFFLLFFVQIMIFSWGHYAWRELGIALNIYTRFKTYPDIDHAVTDQFGASVFSIFFFGIIRHAYDYMKLKEATQQLRIQKQEAELNFLKAQTNPHFLFNTLNNIYSLARDKSDLAPESILRLSEILRFMLYENTSDYISIEKEIKIINDYIALEKLRYDESLKVNVKFEVEDEKQSLPPLLLMPLVENAFKHGISETRSLPFIDIHLRCDAAKLFFIVQNSTGGFEEEDKGIRENIGLTNLRRQLELLYKDYDLLVHRGATVFTASLKINLTSHV
jgi:two-component system LytT family sensor kinase